MLDALVVMAELDLQPVFSAPLLFGVDASLASGTTATGFYFGWRPELLATWTRSRKLGFGIGPYANVIDSTGTSQVWLGGGLSLVGYFGKLGVGISGGADCAWLNSVPSAVPVIGGFVGFRMIQELAFDLPFGVRVDVRPATDVVPLSIAVSAQVDIPGAILYFVAAAATPGFGH
jgi:hypothetical protein